MKTINKYNYEAYAIDYMSGELPLDLEQAFVDFLGENPDIADEILLFDASPLKESSSNKDFSFLQKNLNNIDISQDNLEEFCIAAAEGDLNGPKQKDLENYIGDNYQLKQLADSYLKLKLTTDNSIYPYKEKLKKGKRIPLFNRRLTTLIASSAAIIAIVMSLWTPTGIKNKAISELAMTASFNEFQVNPQLPNSKNTIKDEVFETPNSAVHQAPKVFLAQNDLQKKQKVNESIQAKFTPLNTIRPKRAKIESSLPSKLQQIALSTDKHHDNKEINDFENSNFKQLASNYIYTKVLTKGVENINRLAETNLDYQVIENNNGEPVKVIFTTRFGKINHTLAQK